MEASETILYLHFISFYVGTMKDLTISLVTCHLKNTLVIKMRHSEKELVTLEKSNILIHDIILAFLMVDTLHMLRDTTFL